MDVVSTCHLFLLRKERLISKDEVIKAEENHIVMRFVLFFTPFVRVITQRLIDGKTRMEMKGVCRLQSKRQFGRY